MTNVTYDKQLTALLVIDPYNDFIAEGGKVWNRLQAVAEAHRCVPHMVQVLHAVASSMRCIVDIALATTSVGSTWRPFSRPPGRTRPSRTGPPNYARAMVTTHEVVDALAAVHT